MRSAWAVLLPSGDTWSILDTSDTDALMQSGMPSNCNIVVGNLPNKDQSTSHPGDQLLPEPAALPTKTTSTAANLWWYQQTNFLEHRL
jgi:hypothetical protein